MGKILIILDFDGVIADTYGLSMSILDGLLPSLSKPAFQASLEGTYSRSSMRRILRWIYSNYFLLKYSAGLRPSMLFPEVPKMIEALQKIGIVIVLTSGRRGPVERFLVTTGLSKRVDKIIGAGSASKGRGLRALLREYECPPNRCVLISDTVGDLREGYAEGMRVIGAAWGYQGRNMLKKEQYVEVIDSPKEVAAAVSKCFILN